MVANSIRNALLASALFGLFSVCRTASGAEQLREPEQISPGMTYQEVLNLWGAPPEKQEMESRREDVWLYPLIQVRFKEGRVTSAGWREHVDVPEKKRPEPQDIFDEELEALTPETGKVPVEDILGEIIGSGEDEKPGAPPAKPGAGMIERRER